MFNFINNFMSIDIDEEKLKNKKKIIIIVFIIIIVLIGRGIYFFINNDEEDFLNLEELENDSLSDMNNVNIQENSNFEADNKIVVHISGEIICPGVIILEEGARIVDAIDMADGVTEEADLSKVNLAYVLEDGQKIYIPNVNETEETDIIKSMEDGIVINGSGTNSSSNENTSSGKQSSNNSNLKININTANVQELQKLSGIGEAIASRIVEYRKENGKFNSIEDLKNVSGIGESKFNKIKNNIFVK